MIEVTSPESVGFSSQRLQRVQSAMQRYMDQGKLAGYISLVARDGQVAHLECQGYADIANQQPMAVDHLFRIYSMTKPIASTAVMMLLEEGHFRLNDPIHAFLPEFKEMQVITSVKDGQAELEDAKGPITIRHLLTHTAGMSYGFDPNDYLDQRYGKEVWSVLESRENATTADFVQAVAKLPLRFQPGKTFWYSVSIDVLGRLVEVVSGKCFDEFLKSRIFEPLGMVDTDFWVPPEKASRLAHVYGPDEKTGQLKDVEPHEQSHYLHPTRFHSGGGGLVSSIEDYLRFCQMLLNYGEYNGQRLLGRKTVELMTLNHLPDGVFIDPEGSTGFGLGGFVTLDVAKSQQMGSVGSWGWGGMANTKFWLDFEENLLGILMLQYITPHPYPNETDFRTAVYQAIID